MSDQPAVIPAKKYSSFLPLFILAIAFFILLIWQIDLAIGDHGKLIQALPKNKSVQTASLEKMQKTLDDREPLEKQSKQNQEKLKDIVTGLVRLARSGDTTAQEIIQKSGIKVKD